MARRGVTSDPSVLAAGWCQQSKVNSSVFRLALTITVTPEDIFLFWTAAQDVIGSVPSGGPQEKNRAEEQRFHEYVLCCSWGSSASVA